MGRKQKECNHRTEGTEYLPEHRLFAKIGTGHAQREHNHNQFGHLHAQNIAELSETEFPPGVLCYRRKHFKKMDVAVVDSGLSCDGRLDAADT